MNTIERLSRLATLCCASSLLVTSSLLAQGAGASAKTAKDDAKAKAAQEQGDQDKKKQVVVVTARKFAEDEDKAPLSLTTVDEQQIRDRGIESVRDISLSIPNALVTEFSSRRLSFPYFRGVGSGQGDPAVTTFVDGVPQLTVSSSNLPMLDVERVTFLRGPGGVLYGRNTIGGAIQVETATPPEETTLGLRTRFGNFDLQDYSAKFSTQVTDGLAFGLSANYFMRDGYTTNTLTGNDVDSREHLFARGQLFWTPDDQNEVRFVLYGERARDGGFVLADISGLNQNSHRITQDFEGRVDRDILAGSIVWKHFGESFDLVSITAMQDWEIDETADFDFSFIDGIRRFTTEEQRYFSQEIRIGTPEAEAEREADGTKIRWLAGISGFVADSERGASNVFRPAGAGILFPPNRVGTDAATGDFDDLSLAAFAQVVVENGPWEFTGALRYDYEDKEARIRRNFTNNFGTFPTASTDASEDYDELLPRASVAYQASENALVYAMAARGFKAGGFNLTAPTGREAFGVETSWNYELGVKTNWEDDRIRANVAVFHIDWEDMQLSQFDSNSGGYVQNAGESTSQGIEVELSGRPFEDIEQFEVFASAGWTSTEFDSFVDSFGTDVSGRNLPFAPERTTSVAAQWTDTVADDGTRGFLRAEYSHIGKFFYDASNLGSERYELVNLLVGAGGKNWSIEGGIRNVFDERYIPVAFQANPANANFFVGENAAPRTIGVSFRITF